MFEYKILTLHIKTENFETTVHPVIIYNHEELILCDTGYPNQIKEIRNELKKYNFSINDITKIIITHHDHDHIGSLYELKKINPNLKILSSKIEVPFIEGKKEALRVTQAKEYNKTLNGKELESGKEFIKYLNSIQPCNVDKILNENEYIINGLRTIMTPGHTEGHLSLYLEKEKVLIAGDVLVVENKKLEIPFPKFAFNLNLTKESIEKIRRINPNKIICYHGGLIDKNIKKMLNNL